MQYLTLSFRNAGLFPCKKILKKTGQLVIESTKNLYTTIDTKNGKYYQSSFYDETNGCDMNYIIGINQVSNLMHILVGIPACPSKRKTIFKPNQDIFNLIKNNTYIKYYDDIVLDKLGNYLGVETSTTRKAVENANSKISMIINKNGSPHEIGGYYTWDYVKRSLGFNNYKPIYEFLCNFFNDKKLKSHKTFVEVVEELSKNYSDPTLVNFYNKNKKLLTGNASICGLLFGTLFSGTNTQYNNKTPLTVTKGVIDKITFNGEIIIKIDDNSEIGKNIIESIKLNSGVAKLLEGGFVNIKSISKYIYLDDLNTNFTKLEM